MSPATVLGALLACAQPSDEDPASAPPPTPAAEQPPAAAAPVDNDALVADPANEQLPPPPSAGAQAPPGDPDPDDELDRSPLLVPLPAPPPPVDPASLAQGSWRGKGWVTLRIDGVAPVGGTRPARGTLVSGAGGLWAGMRPLPYLGVFGGVTTFIHDIEQRTRVDPNTFETVETSSFGRMTLFDLAVVRLWLPLARRVQPFADVGGFLGVYRAPYADRAEAAGGGRFGLGVDVWLGPSFSLNFGLDERLISLRGGLGHTLQFGGGATLHW